MAITLIVNGIPFDYPEQGEQQPWGEAATGWAEQVTTVLDSIKGPNDILETIGSIGNGQTDTEIVGFFFDPLEVRSFIATGNIYRTYISGSTTIELSEQFTITGLNQGSSSWIIQQEGLGDSGVTLNLDSSGQMKYTSSSLTNYLEGIIKFKGIATLIG